MQQWHLERLRKPASAPVLKVLPTPVTCTQFVLNKTCLGLLEISVASGFIKVGTRREVIDNSCGRSEKRTACACL
jgi:hypothetical protein